jgi:hypothetical protein
MSEDRGNGAAPPATSAAERMYGPNGPWREGPNLAPEGRAREVIESGIAKPAASPFADERASPGSPPFDAARYRAPDGSSPDQALMGEFSTAARAAGLSQRDAESLLGLHDKALKAQHGRLEVAWGEWHAATQREIGHQLEPMVADIKQAIGDHGDQRDASRFFELLAWSGIEHDPATIRTLHALAVGRRRY